MRHAALNVFTYLIVELLDNFLGLVTRTESGHRHGHSHPQHS
jgi:hypothetical protein